MKLILAFVLLLFSVFTPAQPKTSLLTFTVYAGGVRGTYYSFAEDIRRACPNYTFLIEGTDGSLDNLGRLSTPANRTGTHRIGFSQADALKEQSIEPSVKALQTIMPMYNESMTLMVSLTSGIKTLADLKGKRVVVGQPASGVWFSANYIKNYLGLSWTPVEMGQEEALLNLLTGDVDAVFTIVGHPSRILNDLPRSVNKRIGFLDLSKLQRVGQFVPTTLEANTYVWQNSSVELVAVRSVFLAAKDVPPSAIKALTTCLKQAEPELRKWGHPKWSEINLSR
jgi:uncharacterized protein